MSDTRYPCTIDQCDNTMGRVTYNFSLFQMGKAICLPCQCAEAIAKFGKKQGDFVNSHKQKDYGVTDKEIKKSLELPYWQEVAKKHKRSD